MAEKFPDLSATVISSLKNFLVNPAPILLKLNKHYADHKCSRIATDVDGKTGWSKPFVSVARMRRKNLGKRLRGTKIDT